MLRVKDYSLTLAGSDRRELPVLENVSFILKPGQSLGIAGESGSGKSVLALSLMGLIPKNNIVRQSGELIYNNLNLLETSELDYRKLRGQSIAMVFQEPMTAMNPLMNLFDQIAETLYAHNSSISSEQVKEKVYLSLLNAGFSEPEKFYDSFPHQLSGGMRQRAMIAISLVLEPELIIADEPTTALDASLQIQVLEELKKRVHQEQKSLIFISHDLGVIRAVADNLAILYAGRLLEIGLAKDILVNPLHPYTFDLIASLPRLSVERKLPMPIPGHLPSPDKKSQGCVYSERCRKAQKECFVSNPELVSCQNERKVRCFYPIGVNTI